VVDQGPLPFDGVALAFDDFGWSELTAEASANRCSEEELVGRAIAEYVDRVETGSWSIANQVPGFRRDTVSRRQIDVDLSPQQVSSLRTEAERQGVSVPQLVVHAVLMKLARS